VRRGGGESGGRACGASSGPGVGTPHGLLTRAAILMMIVLSNVQAQGRRDETRPDERDGPAWPPRRGLPTRAARAPRRGLLTRHLLCCHKVRAVSQLRHAAGTDVETFAVCDQSVERAAVHRVLRRNSSPRSRGPSRR